MCWCIFRARRVIISESQPFECRFYKNNNNNNNSTVAAAVTPCDLPPELNDLQDARYTFMPSAWLNCSGGDITHVDLIGNIPQRCPHHRRDAYYPDLPCSLKRNTAVGLVLFFMIWDLFELLMIPAPASASSPERQAGKIKCLCTNDRRVLGSGGAAVAPSARISHCVHEQDLSAPLRY